jgi:ppGpp synthetase/RelA/SpoT-type nucleotidyltranferase
MSEDRLNLARRQYDEERPVFEVLAQQVASALEGAASRAGLNSRVSHRAKSPGSLLKKLLRQPERTYDEMRDKAGARLVVFKLSDLAKAAEVVNDALPKAKPVPQPEIDVSRFGFRASFFSVKQQVVGAADPKARRCEIQVMTEAALLWANLSHRYVYKSAASPELERSVNRLSALMEIVDHEIERIHAEVTTMDGALVARAIEHLEQLYIPFRSLDEAQRELSVRFLELLEPTLREDYEAWERRTTAFAEAERARIVEFLDQGDDSTGLIVLRGQPETIALLELQEHAPMRLEHVWPDWMGASALEALRLAWRGPVEVI